MTGGRWTAQALTRALETAPVAIAVLHLPDLEVRYANTRWRAQFGGAAEAIPAALLTDLRRDLDSVLGGNELRGTYEVGAGQAPRFLGVTCTATSLRGESGILAVAVDVSEHVAARQAIDGDRQRLRVLDRATAALTAQMDPYRDLAALAASVVPALADACAVYLVDPVPPARGGEAAPVVVTRFVRVVDPAIQAVLPAFTGELRLEPRHPIARAVHRRRTVGAPLIQPGGRPTAEAEYWHTALGIHAIVAVPVLAAGAVLAVITFAARAARLPYPARDIALMRQITERANTAVDHALRLQRATDVSAALQRGLLPGLPLVPGAEIAVRYRPAGAGLEIGGDWYDTLVLPTGALAVAVGDAVGHDLGAAATMGRLRSMLQALAYQPGSTPAGVLTGLNELTQHVGIGGCASVVYGEIVTGGPGGPSFRWVSAGHPPPLVITPEGAPFLLNHDPQPLLGVSPAAYTHASTPLPAGSTLVLYTDGLIEDPRRPQADGTRELLTHAERHARLPPSDLLQALEQVASDHDDLALLAIRLT